MIQLFPRASGCEWCGGEHPQAQLCHARPGLTRRSFLCLASTAAVAAIVAPKLFAPRITEYAENTTLGEIPLLIDRNHGDISQWDAILKEAYLPAITEQLNSENTLLKFMSMSPAELAAHDRTYRISVERNRIDRGLRRAAARRAA